MGWMNDIIANGQKEKDKREREYNDGKIADSMVKNAPEILQKLGMAEDEWKLLAPKEKALSVAGVIQAQGYKKALLDLEKMGTDMTAQKIQNYEGATRMQGLERFGASMESYDQTPELIRRPRREVLEGEVLKLHPADAANYSRSIENLGRDFEPGPARPIFGTDYFMQQVGRDSYTTVPGKEATRQRTAAKAKAPAGAASGWIFTEDAAAFKEKLLEIEDAEVRDAVIDARRAFNLANGKGESELTQLLKGLGGGGGKGKEESTTKDTKSTKGVRKWDAKTRGFVDAK